MLVVCVERQELIDATFEQVGVENRTGMGLMPALSEAATERAWASVATFSASTA